MAKKTTGSASPYSREALSFWASKGVNMLPQIEAKEADARKMKRIRNLALAAVAVPYAAAAIPAIAGAIGGGGVAGGGVAGGGAAGGGFASVPGAVSGSAITAASQGAAFGVPTVTGAGVSGVGAGMSPGTSRIVSTGIEAGLNLFGAKKSANAATKSAEMQTKAATEAARIQAQSSADQLEYFKRQSELERLSKRFSDKQSYGLSNARDMNDFSRYGDTSFNARASELSQGRTQDKIYGGRQTQMNYMRDLLGMPQNATSVYVEPDALQLTRPTFPEYVEDPTETK